MQKKNYIHVRHFSLFENRSFNALFTTYRRCCFLPVPDDKTERARMIHIRYITRSSFRQVYTRFADSFSMRFMLYFE